MRVWISTCGHTEADALVLLGLLGTSPSEHFLSPSSLYNLRTEHKVVLQPQGVTLPKSVVDLVAAHNAEVVTLGVNSADKLRPLLEGTTLKECDKIRVTRTTAGPIAKSFQVEDDDDETRNFAHAEWTAVTGDLDGPLLTCWGPAVLLQDQSKSMRITFLQDDGGTDLLDVNNHQGPLTFSQLLDLAEQLSIGLQRLRTRGVIHDDLKPENIVTDVDGVYRIIDFNLARSAAWKVTGRTQGTPEYAAPEKLSAADENSRFSCFESDVWSAAMTLGALAANEVSDLNCDAWKEPKRWPEWSWSVCLCVHRGLLANRWQKSKRVAISQFVGMLRDMLRLDPRERITPEEIILRVQEIRSNFERSCEPTVCVAPLWDPQVQLETVPGYGSLKREVSTSLMSLDLGGDRNEA
ncbi:MAG: uncharacterized protein KVP18_002567 [Porospora cf. gigantea A]|uniref:uncharacterized protein n=1 Tax=Porospora cf. gigantea A TaxID=2853593 RepID=UPI00355A169D|nr:MAG: hypothetical protein KVP18_002567 [Porospora cf. gigantea A]